jgi:carbamoyltransferase
MVKKEYHNNLAGVINVDGSCRPQMVTANIPKYYKLLKNVKDKIGVGVLLNTSFNIHGEPLICSPEEAINVFNKSKITYMVIENFLVSKK